MADQIKAEAEKLDLASLDIAADKRAELLRLIPEARTEGGKIDFDQLKRALGAAVDAGKERYGLIWPGKAECFKTIQAPSLATLRPSPEESVNFDSTENLIVEGDNLEVLKLLQKSYLGKIKMIYIDPPYNTGNDFIYPDNFAESLQTYLQYTGQVDAEGRKFGTNTEADGRFHSKWLNMMYPRLYLARNLLKDDGVLFVSVDDKEQVALRRVLDELFGEENFVESFIWKKSYGGGAKERFAVTQHEYCLMFAKNLDLLDELWLPPDPDAEEKYYEGKDEHFEKRGPYRLKPLEATKSMDRRENLIYGIPAPDGTQVFPKRQWWWSRERTERVRAENGLVFTKRNDEWSVSYKQYLIRDDGTKRGAKPFSIIDGIYTQQGTADLRALFDDEVVVQFPKPVKLIKHFIQFGAEKDSIILDFFAGSGTTGQAVLETNAEDGGNRKFVLVQLPEPTGRNDYKTISDITKERVRRASTRLRDAGNNQLDLDHAKDQDRGFRAFTLADSNFKAWDAEGPKDAAALGEQLSLHIQHVQKGRTGADILYEILLKSGFPLTAPVEKLQLAGKEVFAVADGAMLVCLEHELTLDVIRTMAEKGPERVVCLDEGFAGNDQLKTNAVQTFKNKGVVFRTI
ncbi:MAG: site-specific DNA-methyltransferase [Gammaproteobacteria bacterium]|nr:site-specific DNA-methyltransferase [Gammaproteobacteria bacterium]